jgi:predicted transcriptional regulator
MAKPHSEFIEKIGTIQRDVEYLRPKQIYLRDTWYPIHDRIVMLYESAPNQEILGRLTDASFAVYRIQDTRGPKHKEKVRQELLRKLEEIQSYTLLSRDDI